MIWLQHPSVINESSRPSLTEPLIISWYGNACHHDCVLENVPSFLPGKCVASACMQCQRAGRKRCHYNF